MKYLSFADSKKPFVIAGPVQAKRNARRKGLTTARQQKKFEKLARRQAKIAA